MLWTQGPDPLVFLGGVQVSFYIWAARHWLHGYATPNHQRTSSGAPMVNPDTFPFNPTAPRGPGFVCSLLKEYSGTLRLEILSQCVDLALLLALLRCPTVQKDIMF